MGEMTSRSSSACASEEFNLQAPFNSGSLGVCVRCGSLYAVDCISRGSRVQPDSLVYFHTGMYQDWNLIQQDTAAQAKIEEEQRAEREAKERLDAVWQSTSASGALTRPCWLRRAVRNRHRRAIEDASRRWRTGRRGDSGRTRRKFDFHTA